MSTDHGTKGKLKVMGGAAAIIAVTALVTLQWAKSSVTASPQGMTKNSPQGPNQCSAIATNDQAAKLLMRLFPNGNLLAFDQVPLALGACLLEVDMEAIKGHADTRGFVYLLPDGEHLLNGPLMDKRSKVIETAGSPQPTPDEIRKALESSAERIAQRLNQAPVSIANISNQPNTQTGSSQSPSVPEAVPTESVAEYRNQAFDTIKKLPQLVSGVGQHDVYALVDPLCSKCSELFKQRETLTEQFGIRWHWIPVHTNERGWVMSAHLLKTSVSNPAQAMTDLQAMFNGEWSPNSQESALRSLAPEDFQKSQQSLAALIKYARVGGVTRTPFVAFKLPNDDVEMIAGKPLTDDWSGLVPPATQVIIPPAQGVSTQAKISLPEIPSPK